MLVNLNFLCMYIILCRAYYSFCHVYNTLFCQLNILVLVQSMHCSAQYSNTVMWAKQYSLNFYSLQ